MRQLKFWGKYWLTIIGFSAVIGVFLLVFVGIRYEGSGEAAETIVILLSLYPYYIFLGALFFLVIGVINCFQIYFSVLVSMNVTRKEFISGVMVSGMAAILTIYCFSILIWKLIHGDISQSGLQVLPLMTGGLLVCAGICTLIGTIVLRWGRAGKIVMIIVAAFIGGVTGAATAIMDVDFFFELMLKFQSLYNYYPFLGACVIFYMLVGVFARAALRKVEVRV